MPLMATMMFAVAPAVSVPLEGRTVTHASVLVTVKSSGDVPVLVSVYDWLAGLNGPPWGIVCEIPPAGVTVKGPAAAWAGSDEKASERRERTRSTGRENLMGK